MTISKEIINVLDYLGKQFGIAIDWTSENVMPYLEELCGRFIEYEVFNSFITIGAWVVFLLFFVCWLIPSHLIAKNRYEWDFDYFACWVAVVAWVGFIICSIGTIVAVIEEGFYIVECWKMPEKVILEELKTLISTQTR